MTSTPFPPADAPHDKAKYRQFLIDHGFDPNLNTDGLRQQLEEKTDAERRQLDAAWREFIANVD